MPEQYRESRTNLVLTNDDNTEALQWPYSVAKFKRDNPNASIPANPTTEQLAELNMHPVVNTPGPEHNEYVQQVRSLPLPVKVGDEWHKAWEIFDSELEVAQRNMRNIVHNAAEAWFYQGWPIDDDEGNPTNLEFRGPSDRMNLADLSQYNGRGKSVAVILENGNEKTFGPNDFATLMESLLEDRSTLKRNARTLKNQIQAATSIADLAAIDLGIFDGHTTSRANMPNPREPINQ